MVKGASTEELKKAESGDYLVLDPAFCHVKQAARILGGEGTARASKLMGRIQTLLNKGVKPADIRVICASPEASRIFATRLKEQTQTQKAEATEHIEVSTMRALALDILFAFKTQSAGDRRLSDNTTRLLSAFEEDFVLEDLGTLGTHPRRLQEMFRFFLRGWAELADEGEGWLITIEEQETIAFLQSELRFLQGVLEPALSNVACKVMRTGDSAIKKDFAKPHLFVNDYQNLGRASQLLCHLLATDSLTIAADPVNSVEVFERFPYAAGVEEFVRVNQSATTQTLAQKQAAPHIVPMAWDNPDDEFSGIAEVASERIAAGTPPEHIAVVCFHRLWFERIVSELKTRKLPVRGLYQPLALQGDIRSLERSLPLRIVTALRLLVNPNDSMSWRCWIGFGDYLANSANFVEAKDAAEVKNPEAVFADSVSQWEGYRQSLSFLESCRNQRGLKLLEYLTQSLSASQETTLPSVLNPLLKLGETATPAEMLAVLKREQFFAQFSSPDGVTVTSLEALVGLKFKTVIAAGFVNGFFPSREYFDLTAITINQQKKMEATDKQRLNLLVSAGSNELILSHFKTIEAETADHLNLKSTRIFLTETGTRTSQISLSVHAPS